MRGMVVAVGMVGALVVGPVPVTAQEPPFLPTTDPLPPLAPDEPAPDRAGQCGDDGLRCVRWVEEQLAGWEERFGCDHRAVFPTVYRLLTREIRLVLEDDPSTFDDPAGLGFEAVAFYELYEQMITDHLAGREIPDAWQVAMDTANEGDWTAGHDMLLSISAHVQRDMPHAMARVGLALPDGSSRKPDHDRGNRILFDAYQPIVRAVAERYDPFMADVEAVPVVDDVGAQQLVAGWREGVWRNAESLVTTEGTDAHAASVAAIEANARTWAELMQTGEVPGRRELRDAHCRAFLAAQEGAEGSADTPGDGDAPPPARREEPDGAPADAGVAGDATELPATGGGAAALGGAALVLAGALVGRRRR